MEVLLKSLNFSLSCTSGGPLAMSGGIYTTMGSSSIFCGTIIFVVFFAIASKTLIVVLMTLQTSHPQPPLLPKTDTRKFESHPAHIIQVKRNDSDNKAIAWVKCPREE